MSSANPIRSIKSFVRREGRLTNAQARALKEQWPKFGIEFGKSKFNIDLAFNRKAPLCIDIGVGTGDRTLHQAIKFPENNYLAIEVHRPGIGHLLNEIQQANVNNIRIINHDVIPVLKQQIPDKSISQVFIFFPDPWPKKRHHKRRLINEEFITILKHKLCLHGRIHIATDWHDYAEHISSICNNDNDLVNLAGEHHHAPRPDWRINTRYEKRGQRLQHDIYDFCFGLV